MRVRSLLLGCSLSILIGCLPEGSWAMGPGEQDFEKKSPSIQTPSPISEDRFLDICKDLLRRKVIPILFQGEMNIYLTGQYLNPSLPSADVLRRDLDNNERHFAIQKMVKSGDPFLRVMTSLGIIYNETEPLMLRIASAHLLNQSKTLNSMNMKKVMTDLLEEVFETQYNEGKLIKLDEDIIEEFLKGAQTLPYDSDTRKKVAKRVSEMSHLTSERRVETLFYLPTGEERDLLLLPFLKNESLKLEPKLRLDGIFGLREGEERESLLHDFAVNPRMPIKLRLDALMESSAPFDVKYEFLAQCLNNKHRFSASEVDKIETLQWSLIMDEDSTVDESDESYGAEAASA